MELCHTLPLLHLLALSLPLSTFLARYGHLLWLILSVLISSVYVTFAIDYRVFCVFIKYSSIFTVSVIVAVLVVLICVRIGVLPMDKYGDARIENVL